jgi:hypothetical protein
VDKAVFSVADEWLDPSAWLSLSYSIGQTYQKNQVKFIRLTTNPFFRTDIRY